MNRTTVLARWSIATARPDPGPQPSSQFPSNSQQCRLSRVGTQLVKCDNNLTGAGVTAPVWVPELNRA